MLIDRRYLAGLWLVASIGALSVACGGSDNGSGPVVVDRIDLTSASLTLSDCDTASVQTLGYDAQNHPIGGLNIGYSSTDPGVVSINPLGQVTATGAGSAFLRASLGSLADSAQVTVSDSAVLLLLRNAIDVPLGGVDTVRADIRDCRGAPRSTAGIGFTSSNPGAATVNSQGILTPVALGFTSVVVAQGTRIDTADVVVATHPAGVLTTPTTVSSRPFGIAVRRDGSVLATRLDASSIAVLPLNGGSFTSLAVGATPTDVALSRDGNAGFVTDQGNGAVGALNLTNGAETGRFDQGMDPFRVLRSRDGRRFFVTGNGDTVQAIDAVTGANVGSYAMEAAQNGIARTAYGDTLYVSSILSPIVREIDVASGAAGRSFATSGKPQEVVVSRDGARLFVANELSNYVQVWTRATGALADSILVGAGTFGMAMSPDGQRLYATSPAGFVYIIDPVAKTLLQSLPVGGIPRRVAFNATGTQAVVANEAGWVDFIN